MTTPDHCIFPKQAKTLQNTHPKTVKRDFTQIYTGTSAWDHARTIGLVESYILVVLNPKNKVFWFSWLLSDLTCLDVRYKAPGSSWKLENELREAPKGSRWASGGSQDTPKHTFGIQLHRNRRFQGGQGIQARRKKHPSRCPGEGKGGVISILIY